MAIALSNSTINNNAPLGSVVGVLTAYGASGTIIPCYFSLTKNSAGLFAVSGNNLITSFSGSVLAGIYSVRVTAVGTMTRFSGKALFNIIVNQPPPPTGVTFTPSTASLPDNAPAGTAVAVVSVSMSDGSAFTGALAASPAGTVTISGKNLMLARALTSADNGSHPWSVTATQNGVTVLGSIPVQVNAIPIGVTFTSSAASIPDNAPAGTVVAVVSVSMSDGSAFTGALAASPAGTVMISGNNLVLARALTSADNGSHPWSVTATQNGVTVSGSIPVQVNAIPTSVTFTPSAASIPDNAPAGTVVAVVSVSMSDGSAFTGALAASPAGTVMISGNNLVLARALTSADDGSRQWPVAATQNGVTASGSIPVQVTRASAPPPPTLQNRAYNIVLGSNSIDAGGHPLVAMSASNQGSGQIWYWSGTQFINVGSAGDTTQGKSVYMADAGNGTVTLNSDGDTWTLAGSNNTFTAKNDRTANYLSVSGTILVMSATPTVWTFSPPISASNGAIYVHEWASIASSEGVWTLGWTPNSGGDYPTVLNATTNGAATQLGISTTSDNFCAYANSTKHWYIRQNGNWVDVGGTAPDGLVIYAGSSALTPHANPYLLTTSEGVWTFGTTQGTNGDWPTQLNGTNNGSAIQMQMTNGVLYAHSQTGSWSARQNGNWVSVGTTAPIQGVVAPMAITLSPARATIADNAPPGTLVATANVTMSDASQFSGTLTTSDTNFFAVSGLNIVTARRFTSADDGARSTVITASQGGQSVFMEFAI